MIGNIMSEDGSKRRGRTAFTLTALTREYERATAALEKLTRSNGKVQTAAKRLQKAQEAYDKAVAESYPDGAAVAEAEARVEETKAALEAALADK